MNTHFILGFLLLQLTIILIYLYTLSGYGFIVFLRILVHRYKYARKRENERPGKPPPWFRNYDKKIAIGLLMIVLFFSVSVYSAQRFKWMGSDNANMNAKQYFTVGQVLNLNRKMIAGMLKHPDNYNLLMPLTILQKQIYNFGVRELPENDAEKAAWAELWFVHFYSKHSQYALKPFKDQEIKPSEFRTVQGDLQTKKEALNSQLPLLPKDNKYLDLVWSCLETMATKEFADKEMQEKYYLQNYPGLAQYYAYVVCVNYTKLFVGGRKFYVKMPQMTKRNEQLVAWLRELPDKWQQSKEVTEFVQANPLVEGMRQMALVMTLYDIFNARIWEGTFNCEDKYIAILIEERQALIEGNSDQRPAIQLMKNIRAAKQFYYIAVNSMAARFCNFVLHKSCGQELAGKEDMREFEGRSISIEDGHKEVLRSLFREELYLLGMADVVEEKYWTKTSSGYKFL